MSDTTANAASATLEAEELPKAQSPVKQFIKKFLRRKTAVISFLFIIFILILISFINSYSFSPRGQSSKRRRQRSKEARAAKRNARRNARLFKKQQRKRRKAYKKRH